MLFTGNRGMMSLRLYYYFEKKNELNSAFFMNGNAELSNFMTSKGTHYIIGGPTIMTIYRHTTYTSSTREVRIL